MLKKIGLCLTIIFCCSFLIYSRYPNPDIPLHVNVITKKLEYLAEHKDEYDLFFIGSSRTYRQVVPSLFDKKMAEHGYSIKSFNLGINALTLPEADFYIQKMLKTKPKKLRWILWEFIDYYGVSTKNLNTTRVIYWHTPKQTWWTCQTILNLDLNPLMKIEYIHNHMISFLYHILNAGKAANLIRLSIGLPHMLQTDTVSPLGANNDGYVPTKYGEDRRKERIIFLQDPEKYDRQVKSLKETKINLSPLNENKEKVLINIIKQIKQSGYDSVLIKPPSLSKEEYLIRSPKEILNIFEFNDPIKFPELYAVQRRYDGEHLTEEGSEIYTNLLADRFAEYLEVNGGF